MKKVFISIFIPIFIVGLLFQTMKTPITASSFNYVIDQGTFSTDVNRDGMADGWSKPTNSLVSISQGIQYIKFGAANLSTRTLIEGTAKNITGKDKYYLGLWIKTSAPDVRFYAVKKSGTIVTYPKVVIDNQNAQWQYCSMIIDMSDNPASYIHSLYLKDGKATGTPIYIKQVNLFNLTKEYGLGKELTKSQVDALMNTGSAIPQEPIVEVVPPIVSPIVSPVVPGTGTVVSGVSIINYGAVADANYYNSATGSYYKDSAYKYLATDNQAAFQAAFNSGKNIIIPKGNYYVANTVDLKQGIQVSAEGAVIYTKSSATIKYLFRITADNVKITGMTVRTTLDKKPILNNAIEAGKGSNVYAFIVQSSNVTIDRCLTYNVCRGVHANKVSNDIKNLTVTNCKFYDATMPIFIMFTNGFIIDNCYLECNNSGLSSGFHSLYFGTQTYNGVVTNTNMLFKSVNNGGILQFYSSKYDDISIQNIKIAKCQIETYGTHLMILGEVKNLTLDGITFIKRNPISGTKSAPGKLIFAHEHVYDITIQNSTLNMVDAASIVNGVGLNYSNFILKNNAITTTLAAGTNLLSTVMSVKLDSNTIRLLKGSAGIFFGFGGQGIVDLSNNTITSEGDYILLGSGNTSSAGTLKLTSNTFNFRNTKIGNAFYNNTAKMSIQATGNIFVSFSKLASYTTGTTNINNQFR